MDRINMARICEQEVLATAARLFGASKDRLGKFDDYEGGANLVYQYTRDDQPRILRISYNPDRPPELIQAELHFVEYLAEGGVRVSRPIPSVNGNLLEVITAAGMNFIAVSFVKGRGMRVPDNGYRYREGVSINEYFHNWGQTLGQIHRLAKTYQPVHLAERQDFMKRTMEQALTGYTRENILSEEWLARLPLFLRLIQMQELLHFAQYLDEPDEEIQAGLRYRIHCIENELPYLGFFDPVFSAERPFALS